jgi:putative hydrolase of the HAD superfamily
MPIKAVLFDMFDTLMLIDKNHEFYSPALMRMYKYLNSKNIDVTFDKFNAVYIETRDQIYENLNNRLEEPHFNVRVAKTLQKLGYDYGINISIVNEATAEFCKEFMNYVHIDPHAKTSLQQLFGKYKLGIVSNFAIPECILKLLKTSKLTDFFEIVIVSASINKRKPSPEIFQEALKALGATVEETVFVGDTIDADIEGPKAIGMKAIYIERRLQKTEKYCPDQTIKNLAELPAAIERC